MPIVAVAGDLVTTTSVALAAGWSARDDVLVVEADPSGGDLAAWFDVPASPSLSTVVTSVPDGWPDIARHVRTTTAGIALLPSPAGRAEAAQAVVQSSRAVAPTVGRGAPLVAIVDTGRAGLAPTDNPFALEATVCVVVHRQATQSAPAAAVRIRRLAEQLERSSASTTPTVVAVVGDAPFGIDEIRRFIDDTVGTTPDVGLPVDDLAAAVLGGRTGVSVRRLARLPLMRAAVRLADVVRDALAMPSQAGTPTTEGTTE